MFENIDVTAIIVTSIIIVIGGAIAITAIITEYSRKKLEHELKMAAIQKGVPVPPTPEKGKNPYGTLKAGLVWTALGIGCFLAFALTDLDRKLGFFGLIAFFVGIALIIAWAVEKKGLKKTE
jgi:hypothetical protein